MRALCGRFFSPFSFAESDNNNGISAEDPLLPKRPGDTFSDKKVNNTITSMDSALSNSDNCSDIELDNINIDHGDTAATTNGTITTTTTTTPSTKHTNNHSGSQQQ